MVVVVVAVVVSSEVDVRLVVVVVAVVSSGVVSVDVDRAAVVLVKNCLVDPSTFPAVGVGSFRSLAGILAALTGSMVEALVLRLGGGRDVTICWWWWRHCQQQLTLAWPRLQRFPGTEAAVPPSTVFITNMYTILQYIRILDSQYNDIQHTIQCPFGPNKISNIRLQSLLSLNQSTLNREFCSSFKNLSP